LFEPRAPGNVRNERFLANGNGTAVVRGRHELAERREAYAAVRRALRNGALVRPDACELCGRPYDWLHAHHHNGYDEEHALYVIFLCPTCHAYAHRLLESPNLVEVGSR
jgi:hypothetical protein